MGTEAWDDERVVRSVALEDEYYRQLREEDTQRDDDDTGMDDDFFDRLGNQD